MTVPSRPIAVVRRAFTFALALGATMLVGMSSACSTGPVEPAARPIAPTAHRSAVAGVPTDSAASAGTEVKPDTTSRSGGGYIDPRI